MMQILTDEENESPDTLNFAVTGFFLSSVFHFSFSGYEIRFYQ